MKEYSFFTCIVIFNSLLLSSWIRGPDKLNNDPNISHFKEVAEIPVELMPSKGIFNRQTVRNISVQSMFYETSLSTLRRKANVAYFLEQTKQSLTTINRYIHA